MKPSLWIAALAAGALLAVGCGKDNVTESDVESARDEYREELREAHETLTESQDEVADQMKEAQKAQAELQHAEQQFNEGKVRATWIQQQQAEIKALRDRVVQFSSVNQAEPETQRKEHLASIEEQLKEAESGLEAVNSSDLDSWETQKPEVTAHLEQARQEIQLLQADN